VNTIWKYAIPLSDNFAIKMPEHAQVLCVQMQGRTPTMWALVDNDHKLVDREFVTLGTGNPITEKLLYDMIYIGTYQAVMDSMQFGPYFPSGLVWHIFEVTGD